MPQIGLQQPFVRTQPPDGRIWTYAQSMANEETTPRSALEDRIFDLEFALTSIGGALLSPSGWKTDQQLHQYLYAAVKRALADTPFGAALDQREQEIWTRRAAAPAVDRVLGELRSELALSTDRPGGQ
jgi:hypothetical protein